MGGASRPKNTTTQNVATVAPSQPHDPGAPNIGDTGTLTAGKGGLTHAGAPQFNFNTQTERQNANVATPFFGGGGYGTGTFPARQPRPYQPLGGLQGGSQLTGIGESQPLQHSKLGMRPITPRGGK